MKWFEMIRVLTNHTRTTANNFPLTFRAERIFIISCFMQSKGPIPYTIIDHN